MNTILTLNIAKLQVIPKDLVIRLQILRENNYVSTIISILEPTM